MRITFTLDKQKRHSSRETHYGTVTVQYQSGRVQTFRHINGKYFATWERHGFSSGYRPGGIPASIYESEDVPESDIEQAGPNIRWDDYVGQVTGFPSFGYEPEEE